MISPDALNAWRTTHPWADDDQVEQDLVMTRVAVEIASHPDLRDRLAWREEHACTNCSFHAFR